MRKHASQRTATSALGPGKPKYTGCQGIRPKGTYSADAKVNATPTIHPGNADVLSDTQTNEVRRFYTDSSTGAHASHVHVTAICGICVLAAASTGFMLAQRLRRTTTLSYTVRKGGHLRAIIWAFRGGPEAKEGEKKIGSARRQQQPELEPIRVLKQIRRRVRPNRSTDW